MKAVVYRRYGGPEALEFTELPGPKTHVDSVLIRVKAAGLNRADAAVQAGALDSAVETFFPVVPGWDIAGVVERSGPGAPEFATGDEVIAYIRGDVQRAHGGFAELVSADVRSVARKPSTLSFTEAAGLPLAAVTAYQGVMHALAMQRGESVLVHGAAGGVGSVAVQIAVARGARVIGVGSADDHDYLRALSAQPVAYGGDLTDEALSLVPKGVDAVFDTVGGSRTVRWQGGVHCRGQPAHRTRRRGLPPGEGRRGTTRLRHREHRRQGRPRNRLSHRFPGRTRCPRYGQCGSPEPQRWCQRKRRHRSLASVVDVSHCHPHESTSPDDCLARQPVAKPLPFHAKSPTASA